ncbi:MAG: hypothetical protein A3B47_01560 [Candidatus Levybacteria bacterium RIFCSPLOWO2_01_FULL_39_24]|nr:MAG: hypothetical protein A3B47_01560 [Candidatus Levybacteria bacterium RIFCSPLOWO2_01_FULL_39_24]
MGIGTTNPLTALDVRGNLGTIAAASISAQSSFASLIVDNRGIGDLFTASKSGATKFVITNAGNVGIGTTSPTSRLDVNGDIVVRGQWGGLGWRQFYDGSTASIRAMAVYNNKLYVGVGDAAGDSDVLVFDGSTWSTSYNGTESYIVSLAVYNGKLYAGKGGITDGDGDVLVFNGTTWSTSYSGSFGAIYSLAVYNGKLYAGQGCGMICTSGTDDIFVFDGTTWSTSYNGSLANISALAVYNGKLYAGERGVSNGDGDVFVFDGSTWSTSYSGSAEEILSLAVYNGKLYAGQGGDASAGEGDIFSFDGSAWSTSRNGSQEKIDSLVVYNGKLYAGQGSESGDGDVLMFDGSAWSTSYNGTQERIQSVAVYNGKLYAGQGYGSGDGDVYVLEDNLGSQLAFLQSKLNYFTWPQTASSTQDELDYYRLNLSSGLSVLGNLGVGTSSALFALDVRGSLGTVATASISAQSSFATLVVDNAGTGDLFTASKSGATKFVILNNGNLQFAGTTNFLTTLASAATAAQTITFPDATGTLCLQNSAACGFAMGDTTNWWTQAGGALYPINSTLDFLIGGTSTAAAKFAFINIAGGSPTATISGNLSLAVPTTAGANTFNLLNNSTLNFQRSPGGDAGLAANSVLFLNNNGYVGIGTTVPGSLLTLANDGWLSGISTSSGVTNMFKLNTADQIQVGAALNIDGSYVFPTDGGIITAMDMPFSTTGTNAYVFRIGTSNVMSIYGESNATGIASNLRVGIGTIAPLATFDVRGLSGTTPVASISGQTSFAAMLVDNSGIGDLFTASKSGAPKFVITNAGNVGIGTTAPSALLSVGSTSQFQVDSTGAIAAATGITSSGSITFSDLNTSMGILYMNGTGGLLAQTAQGAANTLLHGNGTSAPTFSKVDLTADVSGILPTANGGSFWNSSSGALYPGNTTMDLLLGATSTASAKFGFINIAGGNPTATISSNLSLAVPTGSAYAATFNLLNNGTLNFQRSPGGDADLTSVLFLGNNGNVGIGTTAPTSTLSIGGTGSSTISNNSGNLTITPAANLIISSGSVGIGTTTPLATLDIRPNLTNGGTIAIASASGSTSFAGLLADNTGTGDLFTASKSGATKFVITNAGFVGIGTTAPSALLSVGSTSQFQVDSAGAITAPTSSNTINSLIINAGALSAVTTLSMNNQLTNSYANSAAINLTGNAAGITFTGTGVDQIITAASQNLALMPGGFVGIGTTAPLLKLDVWDSQSASAAAQIYNTSDGLDADGLVIKLGNPSSSAVDPANHFISFETFGIGIVGSVQGTGAQGVTYATNGIADFAEYFKKDRNTSIPFGSVVCFDDKGLAVACDNNSNKIIGVASEHPAFLGGENRGDESVAVGLVGQVKTRVSTANGEIKIGDPLTTSGIAGVAVKATSVGQILGKAIEVFNGQGEGNILASVNITWYNPSIYVSYDGTLAGMAATVDSIGNQLASQGQALQSWQASSSAQIDYVLETDPLFMQSQDKIAQLQSGMDLLSQKVEQTASISAFLMDIVSSQVLGASTSAVLDLGDVELNSATVSEDLMVLGRTTVTDLGVTGNINAGLLAIHGLDGEINTLAGDLYLQKQGIGGVDILNGKVVIDTAGNMTVAGTITADEIEANNYTVLGDQSIGSASISAGLTFVEVLTPIATSDSKIFLTATSLTDKQLTVVKKLAGKFRVAIPIPTTTPITFDWWIISHD